MLASRLEVLILRDCYITSLWQDKSTGALLADAVFQLCTREQATEAPPKSPHLLSPYLNMESVKPLCRKYSENLIYPS